MNIGLILTRINTMMHFIYTQCETEIDKVMYGSEDKLQVKLNKQQGKQHRVSFFLVGPIDQEDKGLTGEFTMKLLFI